MFSNTKEKVWQEVKIAATTLQLSVDKINKILDETQACIKDDKVDIKIAYKNSEKMISVYQDVMESYCKTVSNLAKICGYDMSKK